MSHPFGCLHKDENTNWKNPTANCPERKKPAKDRDWEVIDRNCSHSAFNGYQYQWSEYSTVHCKRCGACGRTKAAYVDELPDRPEVSDE